MRAVTKKDEQAKSPPVDLSQLEWIPRNQDTFLDRSQGGFWSRFKSKAKQNPFVPIGLVATTCCLGYGLYAMQSGQTYKSQMMMRARVIAQGLTVTAMVVGAITMNKKS